MKLMHLSDLHLGKRLIEVSMHDDQVYILDDIVRIAAEERPRAVLIAGDVYDRANPPAESMALFADFLSRLEALGCSVMVISGNHDSPERVAYLGALVERNGVYLSPVYEGRIAPVTLGDEYGEVRFYLMPYVHPAAVKSLFPEEDVPDASAAARLVVDGMAPDPACRNVILTHQFISGCAFDEREQRAVGTLDCVSPSIYDAFDYVALGHIHGEQAVGRADGTMRYCGSPLKYSRREALTEKSVTMVELGPKGDVRTFVRPLKPRREMRLVRGSFADLIAEGPGPGQEDDYFFATLTDENDVENAAPHLRQRFRNLLALDYDNARTRRSESPDPVAAEPESKSPMALLMDLFRLTHDREMNDEEQAFARQLMRETEGFEE
ncbi:MAG: exonuclease SbcCD subunit D [Clostridia bacterium]|nr:exonuclease SbcCD subunit D [Clostridia bacterium]